MVNRNNINKENLTVSRRKITMRIPYHRRTNATTEHIDPMFYMADQRTTSIYKETRKLISQSQSETQKRMNANLTQ